MVREAIMKRGDIVSVNEHGRTTNATYWYRACSGKLVVFMTDETQKTEYVQFCSPECVSLQAISVPGVVTLPVWAR
jgi:hypothetical protein